ncbi:MAG TPA: type VII secretion-associated protein [Pseudonocardia sp.]|nr:type VII secretion-associated protein [Pseudonocardia sp.]
MSGTPVRVAVQEGAARVRVAGHADGAPWLVAEFPAPGPGVAALLAELVGAPPEELVLVHPGRWPDERVARWVQVCAELADRVRAVPAPLAAAGRGGVAVLDVGADGAEAALLDPDGRVSAWRTAAGGRLLDERLAARLGRGGDEARAVREALSLLPAVDGVDAADLLPVLLGPLRAAADALQAVLAGAGPVPVLLVGGVARTPLLAQVVDEAGIPGAVVAPRPDAAAVLGALALPAPVAGTAPGAAHPVGSGTQDADTRGPGTPTSRDVEPVRGPGVVPEGAAGPGSAAWPDPSAPRRWSGRAARAGGGPPGPATDATPDAAAEWLPPLPPRRRRPVRAALMAVAVAAAVALLLAVGRVVAPPAADAVPAGALVQYGYRLDVPADWEHTGGLPERRRVLLTPVSAPEGSGLIAVELSPLGYDTATEPERARAELREVFDAAVAAGSALSGYDPDARFAGRPVTSYRQQDGRTVVDWFVVLDGDAQLSVGCRHTTAGTEGVRAACAVVVGSVRRM